MWNDFIAELIKLRVQRKNYVVFGGLLLVMVLMFIIISSSGFEKFLKHMGFRVSDVIDGLYFARMVFLPMTLMILPIFICTVSGDMIAGEMQEGCLKLYAARPRSRTRILLSRFLAMAAFTVIIYIIISVLTILLGVAVYGMPRMQLIVLDPSVTGSDFVMMSAGQTFERLGMEILYRTFALLALGSVTFFFSCIFRRMTSATVAGITIYFACYIIQLMPNSDSVRPYLLTTVMNSSIYLWLDTIPWQRLSYNFAHLLCYIIFFAGLSLAAFTYRDLA